MAVLGDMKQLRGHVLDGALAADTKFASLRLDELDLMEIAAKVPSSIVTSIRCDSASVYISPASTVLY
jgi:hypothetical protein